MVSRLCNDGVDGVNITAADQEKINMFARKSAKLEELLEELKTAKQSLEDCDVVVERLFGFGYDDAVPVRMGDIFVTLTLNGTFEAVESRRNELGQQIQSMQNKARLLKTEIRLLKMQLYRRFGDKIHLEDD